VDHAAIRLLHKAMLYDRGKTKVVTTKVNKSPKKVVKTTHSPAVSRSSKPSDDAMRKLRSSGSQEAAADVFLSRMTKDDE